MKYSMAFDEHGIPHILRYGERVKWHPRTAEIEFWEEIQRLRGVIAQHDLCHDLHGKVNVQDFTKGCETEQRRIYGCAPQADRIQELTTLLKEIRDAVAVNPSSYRSIDEAGPIDTPWLPIELTFKIHETLKE